MHSGTRSGSSSAPTLRSKAEQPLAGELRTRAAAGSVQAAAEPSNNIPAKRVHHQQGCESLDQGVKCAVVAIGS